MKYNIMRNKLFVIGILLCSNITHAQQRIAGLNKDIHVTKVGVKPYEMKNTSLKKATLSFMDCSKWYVQTENCEAALYRSNQEIVADEFSGKIVYKTTAPKASVFLGLTKPMELNYIWDCLDVWTLETIGYGENHITIHQCRYMHVLKEKTDKNMKLIWCNRDILIWPINIGF